MEEMRCISPIFIKNSTFRGHVPCGKCNFCLANKRADWSFRLKQELKTAKTAKFITLTYDENHITYGGSLDATLVKSDLQLFIKRLRNENRKLVDWPVRYYAVGEYGTITNRPHYHAIVFNLASQIGNSTKLANIWDMGLCHVGDVTQASIHYTTKYVINRSPSEGCEDVYPDKQKPFALMSRRPGLGHNYLNTHGSYHVEKLQNFAKVNGIAQRLPRYYLDKMFTESERAEMLEKSLTVADKNYLQQIDDAVLHHPDPPWYHEQKLRQQHDNIKNKINKTNLF